MMMPRKLKDSTVRQYDWGGWGWALQLYMLPSVRQEVSEHTYSARSASSVACPG